MYQLTILSTQFVFGHVVSNYSLLNTLYSTRSKVLHNLIISLSATEL